MLPKGIPNRHANDDRWHTMERVRSRDGSIGCTSDGCEVPEGTTRDESDGFNKARKTIGSRSSIARPMARASAPAIAHKNGRSHKEMNESRFVFSGLSGS